MIAGIVALNNLLYAEIIAIMTICLYHTMMLYHIHRIHIKRTKNRY
jgi:hypothetical protein